MITPPPELQSAALNALCRKYEVRELALFGSVVRGEQNANSDLDFLVEFEPQARVGFLTLSRLSRELSRLTHCPVDLVPKAGLKQTIRDQVLAEAQVIYAS
jgi:predicted nucleotidyltransferase